MLANARIFSQIGAGAITEEGVRGRIEIAADSIQLLDGAQLVALVQEAREDLAGGRGDGGDVVLRARDEVLISGFNEADDRRSGISTLIGSSAEGNAGGILVETGSFVLEDGARVNTSLFGIGNAGVISIKADEVAIGERGTRLDSRIEPSAEGNAGSILIETGSFVLEDGAVFSSSTFGRGNPGNIEIRADGAALLANARIFSQIGAGAITEEGVRGRIEIAADSIQLLDGAQLVALVQEAREDLAGGRGDGGDVVLQANNLDVLDGAVISAETSGSGDAGSVIVKADGAVILGQSTELTVETSAAGRPGAIEITAPVLTIGEDAQLSATVTPTATNPDGEGDITLNTTTLNVSGELGIFAETNSLAPAGNLTINPLGADPNLNILFTDNGFISTETTSSGDGGSIDIRAPQTLTIQGQGNITAQTSGGGPAGDITLSANTITLGDGLQITASTTDTSTGGSGSIFLLDAQTINLQNNATIAVDSQGSAPGGNIFIDANDLNLERGKISAETASTDGGNITINLENQLVLRDESAITTTAGTAQAGGNGGNIDIDSRFIIAFPSEGPAGNDIFANAFNGNGGSITIDTEGLLGIAFSEDLLFPQESSANDITVTSTFGLAGDFELVSPEVNPADALTSLPQRLVEVPIFGSCQVTSTNRGEDSIAFYELGRGGVPLNESPTREFGGVLGAWATLEEITTVRIIPPSPTAPSQTASAFRANLKHSSDGGSTHGPARFAPICRLF